MSLFARVSPFTFLSAAALLACGGSTTTSTPVDGGGTDSHVSEGGSGDAQTRDGATADALPDAPPPADGPFACGSATCAASEYCINPCCGGVLPPCVDADDAGACPAGTHDDSSCNSSPSGARCRPDPCTPPPPFCAPADGCGPNGTGGPGLVQGHKVSCLCA